VLFPIDCSAGPRRPPYYKGIINAQRVRPDGRAARMRKVKAIEAGSGDAMKRFRVRGRLLRLKKLHNHVPPFALSERIPEAKSQFGLRNCLQAYNYPAAINIFRPI